MASIGALLLMSKHHQTGLPGGEVVVSALVGLSSYDVLPTGTGTAHSKVVTRCKRALTGQELGRWRRIRSLYCLTCAAILKRVSMMVEGWACASTVCGKGCVRKEGGGRSEER